MKSKSSTDDFELIKKVKNGDDNAFRQLVVKHKDTSLGLACSILKDLDLAEDVLQDVFLKVYQKLPSFRFKSSFTTWFYRIVVNTCYNEVKKRRVKTDIDSLVDTGFEEESLLNKADQKYYVSLALNQLRSDEALALRLFYLCELSIAEIREVTGHKNSKIKVDLHRGRENLYFHLKRLLGKDINTLL